MDTPVENAAPHDGPATHADEGETAAQASAVAPTGTLDLDGIERDLADVEVALARLDAGTYWTDEVTGAALDDEFLAANPTARHA